MYKLVFLFPVNRPVFVFSVPQLIHGGKLDFLVFDYLSEITMSLLTAAKAKMPVSSAVCVPVRMHVRVV